jgi:hypothetical protein
MDASMSGLIVPPFLAVFGVGAPAVTVPHSAVYYDTTSSPYVEYTYNAGAWHITGSNTAGNNAIQIQGVAVAATPPLNNQQLQVTGGVYTPVTVSGAAPNIVQSGFNAGAAISGVTLGAGPAQGNLLIGFCFSGALTAPAGWNKFFTDNGGTNSTNVIWKIAGAGEPATQALSTTNINAAMGVYEMTNGAWSLATGKDQFNVNTLTINQTAFFTSGLIIGVVGSESNGANVPTSIVGATADATAAGTTFSMGGFHLTPVLAGLNANAITGNFAGLNSVRMASVFIG